MPKYTVVREPEFTRAAQENMDEAGVDATHDLSEIAAGLWSPESLLEHCLEGADEDREQGWREYVSALFAAADELPS